MFKVFRSLSQCKQNHQNAYFPANHETNALLELGLFILSSTKNVEHLHNWFKFLATWFRIISVSLLLVDLTEPIWVLTYSRQPVKKRRSPDVTISHRQWHPTALAHNPSQFFELPQTPATWASGRLASKSTSRNSSWIQRLTRKHSCIWCDILWDIRIVRGHQELLGLDLWIFGSCSQWSIKPMSVSMYVPSRG